MAEIEFLLRPREEAAPNHNKMRLLVEGYSAVHDAAEADSRISNTAPWQTKGSYWTINRTMLWVDTSSLAGKTILSAKIVFDNQWKNIGSGKDFDIVIVKGNYSLIGDPPISPLSAYGDIVGETESRGSINTADIVAGEEYEIYLNSIGLSEISTTGITKFALRCSRDISSAPPTSLDEKLSSSCYPALYPKLVISVSSGGYIWVEGDYFAYTDALGAKRLKEGTDTTANGTAVHAWVEGDYFHYIDANGDERRILGTQEGATGKTPAQIWIEVYKFRYIDSSGNERYIEGTAS